MKIYYEDNHIIVVEKPVNVLSQADNTLGPDMVTMVKDYLKTRYNKPGEAYVGLVHRLDRPVSGVMVFAKTSKAASRLSDQIRTHQFEKEYTAVVEGIPKKGLYQDYLVKDKKNNTSRISTASQKEAKLARLEVLDVYPAHDYTRATVIIRLETGRPHQIRVQLASRKTPLWGDQRYNSKAQVGQQIALHASKLSFNHPTTKERLTFASQPDRIPFI